MTDSEFANPLAGVALGDPFVLRHAGRFYLYGTNDGPPLPGGLQIPVYRSDDLLHWEPLGGGLVPDPSGGDYWAPEVMVWNGRFYMVVSFGDVEVRGHALWVAIADRPEGPFRLTRRVSDPSEKFSIDGSWFLDDDGGLYLFRCLDFVADGQPPHGTGIVAQRMRDPLTPDGPPTTILRASQPWQVFESNRRMGLYEGRTFPVWNTIEGPAPVRRHGRYFCGYSGGNYSGAYGTGEADADAPLGPYRDRRGVEGPLFSTTPGLIEGPGHFSIVQPDLVHDWIVLHGRRPGEGVRRVWLCPARWDESGVQIGPLTDQPQPRPPLPEVVDRFAGPDATSSWSVPSGWSVEPEGFQAGDAGGIAWRPGVTLEASWVAETWLVPGAGSAGGLRFGVEANGIEIAIDIGSGECVARQGGTAIATAPLPTLGDEPFHAGRRHSLEVTCRRGVLSARVDRVIVLDDIAFELERSAIGLVATGDVAFASLSVTRGAVM